MLSGKHRASPQAFSVLPRLSSLICPFLALLNADRRGAVSYVPDRLVSFFVACSSNAKPQTIGPSVDLGKGSPRELRLLMLISQARLATDASTVVLLPVFHSPNLILTPPVLANSEPAWALHRADTKLFWPFPNRLSLPILPSLLCRQLALLESPTHRR